MSSDIESKRAKTLEVIGAYQQTYAIQDWDGYAALWAEDGVMEFPFNPKGLQNIYAGPAAIVEYMKSTIGKIVMDGVESMNVIPGADPEVAVAEVSIKGHVGTTGSPYNQRYVLVFQLKDGKLWRYREYFNPLISAEAFGGLDQLMSSFQGTSA